LAISGSASASPAAKKEFGTVRLVTVWLMLQNPAKAAGARIAVQKHQRNGPARGDDRINEIAG
jgi:hypothetical protein